MLNNTILQTKENECSGCGLCSAVCPQGCIEMVLSDSGFIRPLLNVDSCIECGLCLEKCVLIRNGIEKQPINSYAYVSDDQNVLERCSSGGVFEKLASYFFDNGGIVSGCIINEDGEAKHICIDNYEDFFAIHGSKYVQSDISDIFVTVNSYLCEGRKVLFSGTPCQVSAMVEYCNKHENLYTVDLICHGAPGAGIWRRYYNDYLSKHYQNIEHVDIRSKKHGWVNWGMNIVTVEEPNGTYIRIEEEPYLQAFTKDLILGESCYECNYRNYRSPSDIQIGDFWDVNRVFSDIDSSKGVSAVIVKSVKGQTLIDNAIRSGTLYKTEVKEIEKMNFPLIRCAARPEHRDNLMRDITDCGNIRKILESYTRCFSVDKSQAYSFGVFGSYTLRVGIRTLEELYPNNCKMVYHYKTLNSKEFLEQMDETKNAPDFLLIDLLEDEILLSNGEAKWEKQFSTFINKITQVFPSERLILARLYLNNSYKMKTELISFKEKVEIDRKNNILASRYDFIEKNIPGIKIVKLNNEQCFCDGGHRYGVHPYHYNNDAHYMLAYLISQYCYLKGDK